MTHTLKQLQTGQLKGATSLHLSEGLTTFPEEIFDLADTLEVLSLTNNKLSALPAQFGRLTKLKIFFCSDNLFTTLPEVLADCPLLEMVGFKANRIETVPPRSLNPNLRWLILTDNKITSLPGTIGRCTRMQKLMLAGNRLTCLPAELSQCRDVGLLRISAHHFTELPAWLLSMPKLAWLAFAGNPFSKAHTAQSASLISWDTLQIGQVLGEGASGIIYKAAWQHEGKTKEVAVKIFKGHVTSDGLPEDELQASIAAGAHPGLIPIIGQITGHPEHKKGLVMELIPPHYHNLGLPPSFDTCTRDVFASGTSLTTQQVLNIATTIASVAAHLHSRGIMHADLYAHNTLIDDNGQTLFGDFGGACFYDTANKPVTDALQRLEVRAYGYLLDDLLNLCSEPKTDEALSKIAALRTNCLDDNVSLRPSFEFLVESLAKV